MSKRKAAQPKARDGRSLLESGVSSLVSHCLGKVKPKIFPKVDEADSGTAVGAPFERSQENAFTTANFRFLERETTPPPVVAAKESSSSVNRYRVVLIQEGMGNFGSCAYYPGDTLRSAAAVFEGKKAYADHPGKFEDEDRPGRSVRDIIGHFENVQAVETDGRVELVGDLCIPIAEAYDWARTLISHAFEYARKFPEQDFIGLSINAYGDAEKMGIDELLKKGVPEPALAKVEAAKAAGIKEVMYLTELSEAVSCDLVTEAGAGGKLKSILEANLTTSEEEMAHSKKKKTKENEGAVGAADADGGNAGHADAAQDVELIKSMLKKHLGDKEEVSDEECGIAKEAMEAHLEMGMSQEEAEKAAAGFLKASKHMASKREAKKEADDKAAKEAADKAAAESAAGDGEEEEVAESAAAKGNDEVTKLKEQVAKQAGELAALTEENRKNKVKEQIEKVCRESGRPVAVTKKFRALVESAKSVEEVDRTWKAFSEGLGSRPAGGEEFDFSGLTLSAEKMVGVTEGASTINFGDCKVVD